MAAEFTATAESTVTCPVCYEFFVPPHTPKDLACPHTCCELCLQRMVTLNQPGQPIECPMRCPQKTRLPREGVPALKTNLHLKNLAEQHPSYKGGRHYTVPRCAHHDEKTHLYCQPCNQLACQNCILAFHQGSNHSSKDVKTTSQEWKCELDPVLNNVQANEGKCRDNVQKLEDLKAKTLQHLDREEQRVEAYAQKLHQKVDQEKNELKTQMKLKTQDRVVEIDNQVARLTNQADRLKAAGKVATETKASSDYAYITQHASLIERMKQISIAEGKTSIDEIPFTARFLQRKDLPDLKPGSILVAPRELKLVQEIDGLNAAYQIACSPDGLIVFSEFDKKQVLVYRRQHGQYKKHISLQLPSPNTWQPCSVAICKNGKFLVRRHDGIEMYSAAGKYEKTIKTGQTVGTDNDVWSVITMPDESILAGDKERLVITKHNPTGEITQTIKTNITPYYMTLIHDNHIAVSDWETGKVSMMNMETGQETLSIDIPMVQGVCYDEQTQCLLIARSERLDENNVKVNTGVIEQYCCITGRLVACLLQGLYHPEGMAITPDGDNLLVCDNKSVKIYKII